jgi:hypothetical protein
MGLAPYDDLNQNLYLFVLCLDFHFVCIQIASTMTSRVMTGTGVLSDGNHASGKPKLSFTCIITLNFIKYDIQQFTQNPPKQNE